MKRFSEVRLIFLLVAVFVLPRSVLGHDGWIEPGPVMAEKGQPITIALMHGNHSNEHKSFRLAGKWDSQYTRLYVIDPSGKQTDLSSQLIDLGEDPEKTGPKGPKGFHLAAFLAKQAGLYFAVARQERTVTDEQNGSKLRTIRTARSAFMALSVPTVKEAKRLKKFNHWLGSEDNLEIVPLTNPVGLMTEESVALEVRFKGKPSPDRVLSIIRKMGGPASAQDFTTDRQGRVRFVAGPADLYLARVKFDEATELEKASYEATYVFQVFNRP
jgi:uncharacterized GH25 family protein